ncbi:hypothetical protein SESBI_47102 [Sesbania bispinosa]|nr:hypothetical protein SESBI_47102 [Sesbania bispinosa]
MASYRLLLRDEELSATKHYRIFPRKFSIVSSQTLHSHEAGEESQQPDQEISRPCAWVMQPQSIYCIYKEFKKKLKNFGFAAADEDRPSKRLMVDAGNGDPTPETYLRKRATSRTCWRMNWRNSITYSVRMRKSTLSGSRYLSSIHHSVLSFYFLFVWLSGKSVSV